MISVGGWKTAGPKPWGPAPKPPEFIALVFQSDEKKSETPDSPPDVVTSSNPISRSGRTPALPYPGL